MATNEIRLKISIDGKAANAELKLTDENIKELYKSFKYGKQEVNGLTTRISMGFNNAREIIQGATEVTRVFQQTFGKSIQLYGVQEQAEKQLASALGYTSQFLLDYASAMQKVTTHGDEEIIQAQSLIAAFVKDEDQIKQLTKATLDLADAKGMDLRTAADLLTKSVASNTNALSRYGIEIEGAAGSSERLQSAIDAVNKAFGGQAEALAETNIGKLKQFENLLGDVQEKAGGLIVGALNPTVRGLSEILNALNELNPQVAGFVTAIGMFGGALFSLRAFGLTPLIKELMFKKAALEAGIGATIKATMADAGLIASEGSLSVATLGVAGSFRAAGIAVKGFFTSLGPIGWAVLGITTLVEIIGLLGDTADDSAEDMDKLGDATSKFAGRSLKELEEELKGVREAIETAKSALGDAKLDVKVAERNAGSLDELKQKKAELARQQENVNNLIEYERQLTEEIAKKREQIKKSLQSSYKSLIERLEVEEQKTDVGKQLKRAEQAYNHDVQLLKDALDAKAISQQQYEEAITRLTAVYEHKRDEIIKKGAEKRALGLIGEIEKQISSLREQKMFAKSEEELVGIEKKIQELENKKALIELRVKLKAEGKDLDDFSELDKKPSVSVNIPVHLDTVSKAEDSQELQDMKFASMENEFERERAMLDAQYQADLEKYKDVIGAKEILDEYYTKRKQELSRVATEAEIQNTLQALNFIGAAVNQYTVVGKGIAIANAIWNTRQAATAALGAQPWGFWNFALASMVASAGMAQVGKIIEAEPPKMPKFAKGGRLPEGEMGFVEGWYDELIAPEKDFIQVFQQELRPKIYAELGARNIAVQNGELVRKIDELNKSLIERPLNVNMNIGKVAARDIVKVGNREISKEI